MKRRSKPLVPKENLAADADAIQQVKFWLTGISRKRYTATLGGFRRFRVAVGLCGSVEQKSSIRRFVAEF
jgi:hypothetical protein